jgi:hypothetical protein
MLRRSSRPATVSSGRRYDRRLDKASNTEPAEFVAFYLSDSKDRPVIELLGAK